MIKIIFNDENFVLVNPNDIVILEFDKNNGRVTVKFTDKTSVIYKNVKDVLNAVVRKLR
jgi:hypothetical protein